MAPKYVQVTVSRDDDPGEAARRLIEAFNQMHGVVARVIDESEDDMTVEIMEEER